MLACCERSGLEVAARAVELLAKLAVLACCVGSGLEDAARPIDLLAELAVPRGAIERPPRGPLRCCPSSACRPDA